MTSTLVDFPGRVIPMTSTLVDLFLVESYQRHELDTVVANLPGILPYKVSARTGWPSAIL